MNPGLLDGFGLPIKPSEFGLVPAGFVDLTKFPSSNLISFPSAFGKQFDSYWVKYMGLVPTATVDIRLRLFTAAGLDTAADYFFGDAVTGSTISNDTSFNMASGVLSTAGGISGDLIIDNTNEANAARLKSIFTRSVFVTGGPTNRANHLGGFHTGLAGPLTGVQIFTSSSAFQALGSVAVYGLNRQL